MSSLPRILCVLVCIANRWSVTNGYGHLRTLVPSLTYINVIERLMECKKVPYVAFINRLTLVDSVII